MARRPDAALEVALEQRQETFQQAQQVLSARELALHQQAQALFVAQSRVRMVLGQIDAAQRPWPGVPLAVGVLGDLETLLDWCEVEVMVQHERLQAVQPEAGWRQRTRPLERSKVSWPNGPPNAPKRNVELSCVMPMRSPPVSTRGR